MKLRLNVHGHLTIVSILQNFPRFIPRIAMDSRCIDTRGYVSWSLTKPIFKTSRNDAKHEAIHFLSDHMFTARCRSEIWFGCIKIID